MEVNPYLLAIVGAFISFIGAIIGFTYKKWEGSLEKLSNSIQSLNDTMIVVVTKQGVNENLFNELKKDFKSHIENHK